MADSVRHTSTSALHLSSHFFLMLARPGGRAAGRNTPRVRSLPGVFAVRNWTKAAKEGSCAHGCSACPRGQRRETTNRGRTGEEQLKNRGVRFVRDDELLPWNLAASLKLSGVRVGQQRMPTACLVKDSGFHGNAVENAKKSAWVDAGAVPRRRCRLQKALYRESR